MRKLTMMLALVPAMVLLAAAPALAQASGGASGEATVTVESGDTLSTIAGEVFGEPGRWADLYEANQDRLGGSPDLIYPGQVLRVPEVGRQAERAQREAVEPAPTETASVSSASAPASTTASEEQAEEAQREAEELVQAEAELGSPASASASASASAASSASASASAAPEEVVQEAATEQASAPASASAASASAAPSQDAPAAVPSDTTMYLTVPALGISDVPVVEGTTEASLSAGAGHLSTTGYPWVAGSNTYIAGHRIGYPGTPSDHVFYDLPSLAAGDEVMLTDSNGTTYTYAVSEVFGVSPSDTSVTSPIAGRDVVTLQTCTETPDDWTTIGPGVMSSGPESGRLIVRADRVS